MGQVCENCGWRISPNNNSGKGCIFTNNKKIWKQDSYNQPCSNYVMDTDLKEHIKILIGDEEMKQYPITDYSGELKQKDEVIETLQAELAEAKAREKAAVEDLKDAHYQEEEDYYDCGICKYCKKRNDTDCNCLSGAGELFEWRGSEKGASE